MGLFGKSSKKKEKAAADAALAEAARVQQVQAAAAAAAEQKAAAVKRKREEDKQKDEATLANITRLRKEIAELEKALEAFDLEKERAIEAAYKAGAAGKENLKKIKLREAAGVKKKAERMTGRLKTKQTQLETMTTAVDIRQDVQGVESFNTVMGGLKIDAEEVDKVMEQKDEVVSNVQEIDYMLRADAEKDEDDYGEEEEELERYAQKMAQQQAENIPAVPGVTPAAPVPSTAVSLQREEDEINNLEAML